MKSCSCTAIGKKFWVAVTGIVLYAFVLLHMVGNLKVFKGVDPVTGKHALDLYGEWLREMGAPMFSHGEALWITRIVLLGAVTLHLFLVISLAIQNRKARPVKYEVTNYGCSTAAGRTMLISGSAIAVFIVYHILHLTLGTVHSGGFVEGAVYGNVVSAFQEPGVVMIYVSAVFLLGFHLYHGVWSLFQTFGLTKPSLNDKFKALATISALIIAAGFAVVPLSVLFGHLQ
jgi:succinate dehydrogenase / fumarate reductase cytochrome b subunit